MTLPKLVTPTDLYNDPNKIDWLKPIVIDFESYYDKEWSLSKITTEKYIRGENWECIGVSVKVGDEPTQFYRLETGIPVIRNVISRFPTSPVISHNNSFDMPILAWRYNIHPNFMVDTAIMAKLCGLDRVANGASLAKLSDQLEKMGIVSKVKGTAVHNMLGVHAADMTEQQWHEYSEYCKLDSDLCYALYMYMIDKVPTVELIMADITTKMFTKPMFEFDIPLLKDYAVKLETEREQMLGAIANDLGFKDNEELLSNLRSSKKFTVLLERLGVEVPMKWSEKKQEMIPAVSKTDKEFLDLLGHESELVRDLVETKLGVMGSMEQTRTATFIDVASRGLVPIPLRYAAAHTGRYGGCLAGDTRVLVKTAKGKVQTKVMKNVKADDLVFDGREFVEHGGLVESGVKEVIYWDGLVGTPNHPCWHAASEEYRPLKWFKETGEALTPMTTRNIKAFAECKDVVERYRNTATPTKGFVGVQEVMTYDILDCGPRHRFVANGKLVHNSDKLNFQNLSKRTKDPVLRRSMKAMDGCIVLASDSSQIEARVNALLSNQNDLIQLFIDGGDPYVDMATAIFNKSYDEILHEAKVVGSKEGKRMRNLGKECVLADGYGMSAATFKARMELFGNTEAAEMAEALTSAYRAKNNMIVAFWKQCDRVLDTLYAGGRMWFGGPSNNLFFADGSSEFHGKKIPSIRLPNGTYIWYQNLRKEEGDNGRVNYVYDQFKGRQWLPKRIWGSSLVENLCQSLSFAVLKWQAIEIAKAGIPVNLNVHDEWVSVVPKEVAGYAAAVHYRAMKSTPDYIPDGLLDCEVDVGLNYGDLKTVDVKKFIGG